MNITAALSTGFDRVGANKRFILFAWILNVLIACTLALPMLSQLDGYIRGTVNEERLLESMDENWYSTYREDFQKSEIARTLDYSIFGSAPFMQHLDGVLSGGVVKRIGKFVADLLFRFQLNFSRFTLLAWLAISYLLANSFLAGGFISSYASEWPSTLSEFLVEGGKYFGRFFRLSLISLLIYYLFFVFLVDSVNEAIPRWTHNEPSEMTPFVYYMARNGLVLLSLSLMMMCFDYAKICIVVEERYSAFAAAGAGFRFAFGNFLKTFGLYVILSLVGFTLILLYAFLEHLIPQTGYWTILSVFILQQVYIFFRIWLKAAWYASQTKLFQHSVHEQFTASMKAQPATPA